MQPGGILLNECAQGLARFGRLAILAKFRRGLKVGQADVRRGRGRDFTTLFFSDLDVLFKDEVVTKPGRAAEDDQSEKQSEKPFHGSMSRCR